MGRKHCGKGEIAGYENTVGKEKLLVMSNFSVSHSVFKRLVSKGRQKVSLCGNWLNDRLMYRNLVLTKNSFCLVL